HVGPDMPQHHPRGSDAERYGCLDVRHVALLKHGTAHDPRVDGECQHDKDDDGHVVAPADDADDDDGDQQAGQRPDQVGQPHDEVVDPSAEVAGDQAEYVPDDERADGDQGRADHGRAGTDDDPGQDVAAEVVG